MLSIIKFSIAYVVYESPNDVPFYRTESFDQNFYTNSQQYLVTVNQVNIHTRNTLFSAVLQNK